MSGLLSVLLAVLSVWDYPSRHGEYLRLRSEFVRAVRAGDLDAMLDATRRGTELLPDDPTWRYNFACSLARKGEGEKALDELEKAVDLGFRDVAMMAADRDLKSISDDDRFEEAMSRAEELAGKPLLSGPMASIPADGSFGMPVTLGEQNLRWNLDAGCFEANMDLKRREGFFNALYMNRDAGHSQFSPTGHVAISRVLFEAEGRQRGLDLDFPNVLFPYPVFGNCSRALTVGAYWRSLPRAMTTTARHWLPLMQRFYLSNQLWVFPANNDCPPIGQMGDVFPSVTPYWVTTAGRSWSDLPYLKAALAACEAMQPGARDEMLRLGLMAPTLQALLRKSLRGVRSEDDYLTAKAHPTAFPAGGVDTARLKALAAALTADSIPPIVPLNVAFGRPSENAGGSEILYATPFAYAFVLGEGDDERTFAVKAAGGDECAFAAVHGAECVRIESTSPRSAKFVVSRGALSPTNRVDVAAFARKASSGWGAPSFVSFTVYDAAAPYSDPALAPRPAKEKDGEGDGTPREQNRE